MKLIYVWIKKHKNIKDLELVLDKRYQITHSWTNGNLELNIQKLKDDDINIWGGNYNISALVGKKWCR